MESAHEPLPVGETGGGKGQGTGAEGDHPCCTSLRHNVIAPPSAGAEGWGDRSREAKPVPVLRQGRRPSGKRDGHHRHHHHKTGRCGVSPQKG